jgi:Co/Zn/Cd efflux system component
MSDHCCGSNSQLNHQVAPVATIGADSCCSGGVPVFDGVNPRYKRVLWIVIGINGAMFLAEMFAGHIAGSQALKADALDFLADTVTYGLSLAVIGASLKPARSQHFPRAFP